MAACLLLLAFEPFSTATGAQAAECPFGSGLGDGCPAPGGGTFTNPNFFSGYAQQSGQTWGNKNGNTGCPATSKNCHPLWNVAGVDYPIGPYTPVAKMADPAVAVPANCAYHASGAHFSPQAPYLECGIEPTIDVTVNGLDFASRFGHKCVFFQIRPHFKAKWRIENSHFAMDDPACTTQASFVGGFASGMVYDAWQTGGSGAVTQNQFDGNGLDPAGTGTGANYWLAMSSAAPIRVRYNVFLHSPAHVAAYGGISRVNPDLVWEFNYTDGIHAEGAAGHGEAYTGALNSLTDAYNVWFNGQATANVGETLIYPISAPTVVSGPVVIMNDVLVQNTVGGGPRGVAMASGHLVNGVFTVTRLSGGPLAPGMQINGGNMFLFRNTNANRGVGGTWTTQCGINAASGWCPFANNSTAVSLNQASWPAENFKATATLEGTPETILNVTSVKSGTIHVGDVIWGNGGGRNVAPGTTIIGQVSGAPSRFGVYTVSGPQPIPPGTEFALFGSTNAWNSRDVAKLQFLNSFGNFAMTLAWGSYKGPISILNNFVDNTGASLGAFGPARECATPATFAGNVIMTSGSTSALAGAPKAANSEAANNWATGAGASGC